MPGQGMQNIPLRIPEKWDPAWYLQHIREVLALADTRNAIEGSGIIISGQPGEEATISTSEDLQNLLLQTFVLATPSGFLHFERVLTGESGVIEIVDGGANSTITVRIEENGVPLSKLIELSNWGVLGNPVDGSGGVQNINPDGDKSVLHATASDIEFTTIDHTYVADFDEAARDAFAAVTLLTEADETADFPDARQLVAGTNVTLDAATPGQLIVNATGGGGSSGAPAIYVNIDTPSGNTVANSNAETAFASSKAIDVSLFTVGTIFRLSVAGVYGTDTTPPTLRLRVKLGSITVLDSGAVTMTGLVSALGWSAQALLIVDSIGASGDIEAQGSASFATAAGVAIPVHLKNAATVTVDTTAGALLSATVEWGTADTDNTITARQFLVERMEAAPPPDLITLRGTPTRQDLASAATSVTITTPTGVVADDVLLVHISRENGAVTGSWAAVTPPSGWTQLADTDLAAYSQMLVFWKRAGGSEPANYTFTWPGSPGLFSAAGEAGIQAWQGVDTTTAIPDFQTAENASNSNNLDAASATADADGSKLVIFFMGGNGNAPSQTITEPASMTQLTKGSATYTKVTVAAESVVNGATGTRTATFDSAGSSPSQCISLVLKPA